jgi:hypothetical protein
MRRRRAARHISPPRMRLKLRVTQDAIVLLLRTHARVRGARGVAARARRPSACTVFKTV